MAVAEHGDSDRGAKRQKLANGNGHVETAHRSRVFAPYRTIGLVSPTKVPFTSVPLGKTTFQITTSVGRSLQTYDLRRGLNLVFITRPQTPEIITASAAWKDNVFAAWGGAREDAARGVWVFKRGKQEGALEAPRSLEENIEKFCIFGSWIVGVCRTTLLVWKTDNYELYTTIKGTSPVPFTQSIASLPTYLNKIIVGRQDGSAEIWNVSAGKLVYTILPPSSSYGAITALEPTPALSLVAIAYESGPILIHDIRTDQTVITLNASSGLVVTSITFRADGMGAGDDGRKPGVMATASTTSGDVTLWDLNNGGRKAGTLRAAHAHPTASAPGGVSRVEFLAGQGVIVSSGLDNSLKTWIFDETPFTPIPRILHQRQGHGAPVTRLEFLPSASDGSDDTGKWLMSASNDRSLWAWSLRRDGQSTEISQGAVQGKARKQGLLASENRESFDNLKCPPITAITCSLNRDGGIGAVPGKHPIWQNAKGKRVDAEVSGMTGWESVVTAHENDSKARTWFWGRKRAGRWAFETGDKSNVSSVAMSPCGTFAVVGSSTGAIDLHNLQSGLHRQRFPARLTPQQAKQLRTDMEKHGLVEESEGKKVFYRGQGRHACAVVGLAVDNLNKTVISAGSDGKLKFWDFSSGLLRHQLDWSLSSCIVAMRFHRGTDLVAVSCTDGCVRVVDTNTYKLIRELWPSRPTINALHDLSITDLVFSNDGHWIATAMGQLVLLWDLPTGHLVDACKLKASCTSIAFSPTGEYLATASSDSVGVDIWTNRTLFTHVPTRHITASKLITIMTGEAQAPTSSGENADTLIPIDSSEDMEDTVDLLTSIDYGTELDTLSSDLVSLSLVPRSRWQNLLHLDLLRQRNKPIEPPKKPEKAPFFLPSLQDRQAAQKGLLPAPTEVAEAETALSRIHSKARESSRSQFTTLLHSTVTSPHHGESFSAFFAHLKALTPSAADLEIRSLSFLPFSLPNLQAPSSEISAFVEAITWSLRQHRDFETVQAWMAVWLRCHGSFIGTDDTARRVVELWKDVVEVEKARVEELVGYANGMAGWLRAARV
ncbi:hypothetical protein B0A48_06703 [Cryoendolithus antarcticus]|uniref:Small-subunit processome Utp21 domain-containing protein n=1 Tax=Cryoendolithus antarcticus TaxID=1507870 RepID=A0A1V8T9H9_9PEZI|nr:hypothetical protein B0A48_06703 [Cryoendolithus antarcticus]